MRLIKRLHAPGTAPGTFADLPAPTVPTRLTSTVYDLEHIAEAEIDWTGPLPAPKPGAVTWFDMEGGDPRAVATVGDRLGLHPLLLEDLVNLGQRPKVEEYDNTVFVVTEYFYRLPETQQLQHDQVGVVVVPDAVLSVREVAGPLFDQVRQRLAGGKARIRGGGAGYLAYALIDTVVDHLFVVLQGIGESIEELEEPMLDQPTSEHLTAVHELKREVLMLRKSVWPLRDMVNTMVRDDSDLFSDETRLYLRDVADHAARALDIVETYREMLSSLMDLYLSSVSNRMNEVMKVLTIIATIFIPLSFIAGLYGMNFDPSVSPFNMPELGWYWGYPAALLAMLAVALGLLAFFRRRAWI